MEQAGHKGSSCPRRTSCITRPYFYKVCCASTTRREHGHHYCAHSFVYRKQLVNLFYRIQLPGNDWFPLLSVPSLLRLPYASRRQRHVPKGKDFILPCISLALHMFSCITCTCDYASVLTLFPPIFLRNYLSFAALVQAVHFRRTSTNSMG